MKYYTMEIEIIEEAGFESALRGLALNHKKALDIALLKSTADRLAHMDGGHNKFLESMYVWAEIKAPRYWWQEADTYRLSTKQSESTMHTLVKDLKGYTPEGLMNSRLFEKGSLTLASALFILEKLVRETDLLELKKILPEGFLQKRVWCLSYKTIRNIISQRKNHRLPHWKKFCWKVMTDLKYPEFIKDAYASE